MNLKNKLVLVLGATGGIGRELVSELDSEGASFILVARSENELQNIFKSLKSIGSCYYTCDFSNQTETLKVAKKIALNHKKIDILICSAGIGVYKPIELLNIDDWNKSMDVNVSANFIFIKEIQKCLEVADKPLIFTIGSGAGVIPMAERSVYCATKFALRGLILSLAEEFSKTKIKFCLITLGSTLTSFGPMSLEEKEKEALSGKAYFTAGWVGKKLTSIIKDGSRSLEYILYPSDYDFGHWEKPQPVKIG